MIGRVYATRWWFGALLVSILAVGTLWLSLVLALAALALGAKSAWIPLTVAAATWASHAYRAWLRQDMAWHSLPDLRAQWCACRLFDLCAAPLSGLINLLGLLSSLAGNIIVCAAFDTNSSVVGRPAAYRTMRCLDRARPRPRFRFIGRRRRRTIYTDDQPNEPANALTHRNKERNPAMHVVLWDTRKLDVSKDFAGGFGVGQYHGKGGVLGWIVRRYYRRDHRPVALAFAYLAAIFRKLGHRVEYAEDDLTTGADLYVFNPSLITLELERAGDGEDPGAESQSSASWSPASSAYTLPEAFQHLDVTMVKGECEQLFWKLDEVLAANQKLVEVGSVKNLDDLPLSRLEPVPARPIQDRLRLLEVPHRARAAKPRLHVYLQLLPLHRRRERHPLPHARVDRRRNPLRYGPLRFPVVQVPRSAVWARP